jgi:hypothetical protein
MLLGKLHGPAAVALLRDADNQAQRRRGLEQARASVKHCIPAERIAIGVADPCREAWHLAGFEPDTHDERTRLSAERRRLGLDPTRAPQQLTRSGERNIKSVLARLTDGDREREAHCLAHPELHARGRHCGLSEFLDEIDARVVPAITGHEPSR